MAEYFSHDYNARNDEKIMGLVAKMGYEGYGLYWAIVELLYQNDGTLELDYDMIAYALHCDKAPLKRVITEFKLFNVHEKKLSSASVLHRIKKRKSIADKKRKAAKARWDQEKQKNADAWNG